MLQQVVFFNFKNFQPCSYQHATPNGPDIDQETMLNLNINFQSGYVLTYLEELVIHTLKEMLKAQI